MNYKDRYNRKNSVLVCFNDEEFKVVESISSTTRKPKATALREFILNKELKIKKSINTTEKSNSVYELNKIGVNINQITRAINTDMDKFLSHDLAEDFLLVLEEIINDIEIIKQRI
jgi:hypothetical protein